MLELCSDIVSNDRISTLRKSRKNVMVSLLYSCKHNFHFNGCSTVHVLSTEQYYDKQYRTFRSVSAWCSFIWSRWTFYVLRKRLDITVVHLFVYVPKIWFTRQERIFIIKPTTCEKSREFAMNGLTISFRKRQPPRSGRPSNGLTEEILQRLRVKAVCRHVAILVHMR